MVGLLLMCTANVSFNGEIELCIVCIAVKRDVDSNG